MSQRSHTRDDIRKELLPQFEELVDVVYEARLKESSMEAEESIAKAGDKLGAKAIGQWLLSFDRDDDFVTIDGKTYYRLGDLVEKSYSTKRGHVRLARHIYRPMGEHNGAMACPLEIAVGMVQGQWTPGCAVAMAYAAQELPERSAAKVAARLGAMAYSYSSFQRLRGVVADKWEKDRDLFEDRVIEEIEIPTATRRLAVSIDRVSLPILEDTGIHYRMAYCGTVTLYNEEGEPIKTLRYGRMPYEGAYILREQMRYDVEALLRRCHSLDVVCLSDGAAELCNILDKDYPEAVARYIDFYHVVEKLAAAVNAYTKHRPLRRSSEEIIADWRLRLLNDEGAIDEIEAIITGWDVRELQVGDKRPVHEALTYIENHRPQMRYAQARKKGHPIGSGHVEACCKQLVQCRMKRSGQRWKEEGGQAVLTLRSLATDARWDVAMAVLMPTFKQSVQPANQAA